uniref:Uncharacterized protein n=1 Tax=Arundo donax TaxID=35708 RepID=A0A0A9BY12_ARUDO
MCALRYRHGQAGSLRMEAI